MAPDRVNAMPRPKIPLPVADVSAFARALAAQLDPAPPHQSLLNMLARAAGLRNFQALRALAPLPPPAPAPADLSPDPPEPEPPAVARMRVHYDAEGRLLRWPARRAQQVLALWVIWARLPRGESMTERQVGARIAALHLFGDIALLRRDLVDSGLMTRTRDGRDYRRVDRDPPAEAAALIRALA